MLIIMSAQIMSDHGESAHFNVRQDFSYFYNFTILYTVIGFLEMLLLCLLHEAKPSVISTVIIARGVAECNYFNNSMLGILLLYYKMFEQCYYENNCTPNKYLKIL